jgi:hypothetical protein
MNKIFNLSLLISLMIHSLLLGSVVYFTPKLKMNLMFGSGQDGQGKGKGLRGDPDFDSFFNPKEVSVTLIEAPKKKENLDKSDSGLVQANLKEYEELSDPNKKCEDNASFGGIGVSFEVVPENPEFSMVKVVPTYYPAFSSGIRVGDKVLTKLIPGIKGSIGSKIELSYLREQEWHSISIVRQKICYDKKKKG